MNVTFIESAEALAKKAAASEMGHEAKSYAEGALMLTQAAVQLHYAEQPVQTSGVLPTVPEVIPEGGTD